MTLEYYKKINNFHGLLILIFNTLINPFPLKAECVTQNGLKKLQYKKQYFNKITVSV